jgi:phosphoribosylglycinamide formyltransferase-1
MVDAPRLGVLASGRGSNFVALLDAHARGDLPARTAVVISNNSRAGALEHARKAGIPAAHISSRTHEDVGKAILDCLVEHDVSVVVLAGYMKLLDPRVLGRFEGRVVNIHPAPLPRFGGKGMYGMHVHEAVLAAGVETSGPTVHLATGAYDEGPTLGHTPVSVRPDDTPDTLAARVLEAEHDLYWRVIRDHFC